MQYRRTASLSSEFKVEEILQELERIEQALEEFDIMRLKELHVEPSKPRSGMTVLADGSDWNPGSGQGVYSYYNGAWHKLG